MGIAIHTTFLSHDDPDAQGIETLHPVTDLATAKAVYAALLGGPRPVTSPVDR